MQTEKEDRLIETLFARHPADGEQVLIGPGDDAAMLRCPPGKHLLITTDTLNEGVHFPAGTPAHSVGYRALAVSPQRPGGHVRASAVGSRYAFGPGCRRVLAGRIRRRPLLAGGRARCAGSRRRLRAGPAQHYRYRTRLGSARSGIAPRRIQAGGRNLGVRLPWGRRRRTWDIGTAPGSHGKEDVLPRREDAITSSQGRVRGRGAGSPLLLSAAADRTGQATQRGCKRLHGPVGRFDDGFAALVAT